MKLAPDPHIPCPAALIQSQLDSKVGNKKRARVSVDLVCRRTCQVSLKLSSTRTACDSQLHGTLAGDPSDRCIQISGTIEGADRCPIWRRGMPRDRLA